METRANYVLVGSFAIIVFALGMLFTLWLTDSLSKSGFARYDIVFQGPVRGLVKGGEVRFNGIKVGEIEKLSLDEDNPERVIARIRIDEHTPVRTSSEAKLEALGLTGINLIQLTAGDTKDPLLRYRPGRPPPRIVATPGALDDLVASGQEIVANANKALAKLELALSEENIQHLANTLANLDTATTKIARDGGLIDNLDDKVSRLDSAITSIDSAATSVKSAAAKADTFMTSAQDAVDTAAYETLPDVSTAARDLRRLSVALQRLSGDIETGRVGVLPGGGNKPVIEVAP